MRRSKSVERRSIRSIRVDLPSIGSALGISIALPFLLAACTNASTREAENKPQFPAAARPVADIVSARWSDEDSRDKAGESVEVMDRVGVKPGMTVADIGAGEGYYTIRLARRVGPQGRVLAQDIIPEVRDKLVERVQRDRLANVTVKLGTPDNPGLPANSFDRIFLVHMYHEIESPYAFLWNLRPATKAGGRVIVVDADRPTNQHGTPPALLRCEFAAVGYKQVDFQVTPATDGYLAAFAPEGPRPAPDAIKACKG